LQTFLLRLVLLLQRIAAHGMEWAIILLPLGLYFLHLSQRARRNLRPVVLSGRRSLGELLLGLSGFLLLGPPSWVAHLFRAQGTTAYWSAYAIYLVALGLVCAVLLARQRRVWVVSNVAPERFGDVLKDVLAGLAVPYTATPGRIAFADGRLVLDIEASASWHTVTLEWYGDDPLRPAVEQALFKALAGVDNPGPSPAAFLSVPAALIFFFALFATALFGTFGLAD
jgi:hypothetical protein